MTAITLRHVDGTTIELPVPPPGYDALAVKGYTCECGRPQAVSLPAYETGHDTYTGDAVCPWPDCRRMVGRMTVRVETIFGIAEDDAVLTHGRARVYR